MLDVRCGVTIVQELDLQIVVEVCDVITVLASIFFDDLNVLLRVVLIKKMLDSHTIAAKTGLCQLIYLLSWFKANVLLESIFPSLFL